MSSNATHGGVMAADPPDGTDQICIFCHTPHGAATEGPLWNRNAPTGPAGGFKLYANALAIKDSYVAGVKAAAQYYTTGEGGAPVDHVYPNGSSRLCMSCHDGVTAINILRNGGTIAMVANSALLDDDGSLKGDLPHVGLPGGTAISTVIDLSTSHPISFIYKPPSAPSDVVDKINAAYGSVKYELPLAAVDTPLDSEGRMQCTTCHDPHLDANTAIAPFWRETTYNAVCDNCHTNPSVPVSPPHPFP